MNLFLEGIDYYDVLAKKGVAIDPGLDRKANYDKLQNGLLHFGRRYDDKAKIISILISEAMQIFSNQNEYEKFRIQYLESKIKEFITANSVDSQLLRTKFDKIAKDVESKGISRDEIDRYLINEKITVVDSIQITKDEFYEFIKHNKTMFDEYVKSINPFQKIIELAKKQKKIIYTTSGLILVLLVVFLFWNKPSETIENKVVEKALMNINSERPEFLKIRQSAEMLNANITLPGAKEALNKVVNIFIKFGDEASAVEGKYGKRDCYQLALKYDDGMYKQIISQKISNLDVNK